MTALIEELSRKARNLAPEDRARLAEDLLASLEDGSESAAEVETAWESEIRRRVEAIDTGTANLIAADDVFLETRQIYRE